jgi:hypothetical protein
MIFPNGNRASQDLYRQAVVDRAVAVQRDQALGRQAATSEVLTISRTTPTWTRC